MDFEAVKTWLTSQTNKQIQTRRLFALLGFALTPLALAAAAGLIFWLVWAVHYKSYGSTDWQLCLWITLAFIPVLFIANHFTPQRDYMDDAMSSGPATSLGEAFSNRQQARAHVFLWVLFTGPRLVNWAIFCFREISRLKQQDTHSCAAVLWVLLVKRSKVPYGNLQKELDWLDMAATLPQLKLIPGVLFLKTPPPGLSLTDDLRTAIRGGKSI